jgi:hypothetical protein
MVGVSVGVDVGVWVGVAVGVSVGVGVMVGVSVGVDVGVSVGVAVGVSVGVGVSSCASTGPAGEFHVADSTIALTATVNNNGASAAATSVPGENLIYLPAL